MKQKVEIQNLPITEEFLREKRLIQDRGELALIEDGKTFKHLGYFSLNRGENFFRGGHFHRIKIECFYIISGKLLVELVDVESGEAESIILKEGQKVKIYPMCAHRFSALEDAQVIEYYDSTYNPDDDIKYNF